MPSAEINSINLSYQVEGEGEPVLLIAGLGMSQDGWSAVRSRLSQEYQVITFDNRGTGQSGVPSPPYSISAMADDASQLLDHLGIMESHVLGLSMGGFVALRMAVDFPAQLKSLILVASGARLSAAAKHRMLLWQRMRKAGVDRELRLREQLLWTMPGQVYENEGIVESLVEAMLATEEQREDGFDGQVAACLNFEAPDSLQAFQRPVLVVAGERDLMVPAAMAQGVAACFKNAGVVEIPAAGHALLLFHHREFCLAVERFLNEVRG